MKHLEVNVKDVRLYKLFDDCVKALTSQRFETANDLLAAIAVHELRPSARVLFDKLKSRIPQRLNKNDSAQAKDVITLSDVAVILLMTDGDEESLARSLLAVERLRANSKLTVQCVLLESLPAGTDVNIFQDKSIPALPKPVIQAMRLGTLDYVVEYGTMKKTLQRALRCAAGRYVCLLREGDEIRVSTQVEECLCLEQGYDVLVVGSTGGEVASQLFAGFSTPQLKALPMLLAVSVVYDGALLIERDYFDDLLGTVAYDADHQFFGYVNEIVSVALSRMSGRVGFNLHLTCAPDVRNLTRHHKRIREYTLYCIESRRRAWNLRLEARTEALLDSVLETFRNAYLTGAEPPKVVARKKQDLKDAQTGKLPQIVWNAIQWLAAELRWWTSTDPEAHQPNAPRLFPEVEEGNEIVVSLFSSLFRGHRLVHSFLLDITRQSLFPKSELLVVLPESNMVQDLVCEIFSMATARVRLVRLPSDPGIYGCWNAGIREARGRYVSNANLDDRRDANHVSKMVEILETTNTDVASSAVAVSHDLTDISGFDGDTDAWLKDRKREVWFGGEGKDPYVKALDDFFHLGPQGEVLQCMNFPHCMPVWRRALHERFGYFDEALNGTYADFAFWLQVASSGGTFRHVSAPLGLYYVDPTSHSRRNSNQTIWQSVVARHLPKGTVIQFPVHVECVDDNGNQLAGVRAADSAPRINFGTQIEQDFGRHRSGWAYALGGLAKFHDPMSPVYCDAFIEKKFVWGSDEGDGGCGPVRPYLKPWVGFVHVPPYVPSWFQAEQSNQRVFSRRPWQKSAEHCRGLFVLTEHHRRHLLRLLDPQFPVSVLYHPTEFPDVAFDFDRYLANPKKRIVQIGWWLRKLHAIANIPAAGHVPTLLGKGDWTKSMMSYAERRVAGPIAPMQVDVLQFLANDDYDQLLAENLVFLDLYDTSANNAVIESIARGTPIIVTRHPAVEEYLGKDYPLFFDNYQDIEIFLKDKGRLRAAHMWLLEDSIRKKLDLTYFARTFQESEVIQNLTSK
jgi:hypothetical protein